MDSTGSSTARGLVRGVVALVAAALVLVVSPSEAHAAVIVTTHPPTIASGALDPTGASTFRVTARATFDDAVPTWAEVTFIVNGMAKPDYPSVQTMPGSKNVTSWNSYTCTAEGTISVTTRWQYVGSIGASEATTAEVQCHVGLASLLSPGAKKALGIAAAVLGIAGAVLCLPATAAVLGVTAAAGVATLGTVGGLTGIAGSAIGLGLIAADPVDPAYDVLVTLVPLNPPPVPAGGGVSAGAAALLSDLLTASARVQERATAMAATLDKWQGAYAAADQTWADAQAQAVHTWASQLASALVALADVLSALPASLASAGLADAALTEPARAAGVTTWLDDPSSIPAVASSTGWSAPLPGHDGETLLTWLQGTLAFAPPSTIPATPLAALAAAAPGLREAAEPLASFGPVVSSIEPATGPEEGGTSATVTGERLDGVGALSIGGVPVEDVLCLESSCTFTTPPGAGAGPIVASTGIDVSPLANAPTFTYAPSGGNLLTNGSLEGGGGFPATSNFVTVDPGSLGPWSVTSRAIDVVGADQATAARGRQFVDLNGNREESSGPGEIRQTVTTTPGHAYTFSFSMAGNPNGEPAVKRLIASVGARSQEFGFDTTTVTNDTLGWVTHAVTAAACTGSLTVSLRSTTAGMRGPNVDDLRLVDNGAAPGSPCSTAVGWNGQLPRVTLTRASVRWSVPADLVMASFQVRTRTAVLGGRLGPFSAPRALPGTARVLRLGARRGSTTCLQVTAVDSLGHRATAPTRCSTLAAPDSLLGRSGAAWRITRGARYTDRRSLTALRKGMALRLPRARGSRVVLVVATRPGGGVLGLYLKGRLLGVVSTAAARRGRALRTVSVRLTGRPVVVRVLRPGRGITIDGFAIVP